MKRVLPMICAVVLLGVGMMTVNAENLSQNEEQEVMVISETKDSTDAMDENNKKEELTPNKELVTDKEKTTNSTEESAVKENTTLKTLPKNLHGEWQGEGNLKSIFITEDTYTVNGTEYKIKSYTVENNTYILIWDEDTYIQKYGKPETWNPQPLIFTYNMEKDVIDIAGNQFIRKSTNTIDDKDKYEKFVEKADIPEFLQDKWVATVGGEKIVWTMTPRAVDVNGVLTYKIIAYGINGNEYTLIWDSQAYIDQYGKPGNFNPQPFVFEYVASNDTLVALDGTVFYRETKKTTDSKKEETKTPTSTDDKKKLPQTGEKKSVVLAVVGGVILLVGAFILVKKIQKS